MAPAAHALLADVAATAFRWGKQQGLGLATRVHLVPFQCRMRVSGGGGPAARSAPSPLDGGSWVVPTAQASFADSTRTALSSLMALGLGVAACFQTVPFQCRIRVSSAPPLSVKEPTAQMSVREAACTPLRMLPVPARGLATTVQAETCQCSMRACPAPGLESLPTAPPSPATTTPTPLTLFPY